MAMFEEITDHEAINERHPFVKGNNQTAADRASSWGRWWGQNRYPILFCTLCRAEISHIGFIGYSPDL